MSQHEVPDAGLVIEVSGRKLKFEPWVEDQVAVSCGQFLLTASVWIGGQEVRVVFHSWQSLVSAGWASWLDD